MSFIIFGLHRRAGKSGSLRRGGSTKRFISSRSRRRFIGIAPGVLEAAANIQWSRMSRMLITKLIPVLTGVHRAGASTRRLNLTALSFQETLRCLSEVAPIAWTGFLRGSPPSPRTAKDVVVPDAGGVGRVCSISSNSTGLVATGVLRATVGVVHQPGVRHATADGDAQGLKDERAVDVRAHAERRRRPARK